MEKEKLFNKLNHKEFKLKLEWVNANKYGFSRDLLVRTSFNKEFIITWFKNNLTFKFSGLNVDCEDFKINGNYPDKYKYHILVGDFCVSIPITEY